MGGQKLRNNRVSIGEDLGNFQVAETIAKYPVGADVTVYYNSRHPREAVLERDLPQGLWGCLGIATAIALVVVFGSAIGLNAHQRIRQRAGGQSADVGAGGGAGRLRPGRGPVRAGAAPAVGAGKNLAGGAGHHQTVRPG